MELSERAGALRRPWPYLAAAGFSLITAPVLFSLSLVLGLAIGMAGAVIGAASKHNEGVARGGRVLGLGLAFLVGPAIYIGLAVV